MAQYSSYYTYQKYVKYGNQDAVPVYPAEYSISGDSENTMPLVIKLSADTECGYVPPTDYQYRTVQSGYTCVGYDQYTRMVRQRSADGIYWENIAVSAGTLIMENSTYCGYIGFFKRWVESGTTCYEGDKYIQLVEQISYDSRNWTNTGNIDRGELIEMDSEDCIKYRWTATTGYVCSGTNKMTKEVYQVSYDGGSTWENVVPEESRAALPIIESASTDCGYVPTGYSTQYLTFIPTSGSSTFKFSGNTVQYSLDSGITWTSLASNTNSPTVNAGDKIMWKSTLTPTYSAGIGRFNSSNNFIVEGNAMSLLYGDNFVGKTSLNGKNYAFKYLFDSCTGLTSTENLVLPATTLVIGCYQSMFANCSNLIKAPVLNATTLASSCYHSMFYGCTSLTTAPELPATTLADYCYEYMFYGCTSLITAPVLPATTLTNFCYMAMFWNCSNLSNITCFATDISAASCTGNWVEDVASTGTFIKAASMTGWTTGNNGIPNNWTVQNYS